MSTSKPFSSTLREVREMERFEGEYMKLLTKSSVARFAKSGTVPAADTKESLLEACNAAAAKLARGGDDDDDEIEDEYQQQKQPEPQAAFELDDTLLSIDEKQKFRAQEHNVWLFSCPSRLRSFFNRHEGSSFDCFCDIVVRLPIVGAGREEVLSFCLPFGDCEYQGPCRDEFCHIVTFSRGSDAIKFFIEVNGHYVDPRPCQATLEGIVASAVKASSTTTASKDPAAADIIANQIPRFLSDLHVKSGEKFQEEDDDDNDVAMCWSSRLIFVTCDFFRVAFFNKQELSNCSASFIPRSEILTRSCYEPQHGSDAGESLFSRFFSSTPTKKKKKKKNEMGETSSPLPDSWSPTAIICRRLALRARELIRVFPLVASHKEIEWVGMCRAANCVAFFVPIPAAVATKDDAHADLSEIERTQHQVWFITLRALRQCKVNIVALFRAVDGAVCVEDLMEGSKLFALRSVPLEPPSPTRSRGKEDEQTVAVLPSLGQIVQGFFSPDPGQRDSNRIFELGAFFILAVVAVWAVLASHGMLTQPKPRFGPPKNAVQEIVDL